MHMMKRLALAGAAIITLSSAALACDCDGRALYSCYGGGYDCHFVDGYGRGHSYGPYYGGAYGYYDGGYDHHYIIGRDGYDGYWRDGVRYDRDGNAVDVHWHDWHDGHFDGHDGWHDGDGHWHGVYQRDGHWREGDGGDFRGGVGPRDGGWHDGDHHDGDWHDGDHHDGDHDGHDSGWHDGRDGHQ